MKNSVWQKKHAIVAGSLLLLSACSDDEPSGVVVDATLVVPEVAARSMQRASVALSPKNRQARAVTCELVPNGYSPLVNAAVNFYDLAGNELAGSATTDQCGHISGTAPPETRIIKAKAPGYKDLVASVLNLNSADGVASTIAADANYVIGSVNRVSDSSIGFTVVDDLSNKSVIGLPSGAVKVLTEAGANRLSAVRTGATVVENASVVMVTDASGSMATNAFTDPDTGQRYSRQELAAVAAHTFLDSQSADNETALTIFDQDTNFIDKAEFDALFSFVDANDADADIAYPGDGFSEQASELRIAVDLYNRQNQLWGSTKPTAPHADTPAVESTGYYPWGGSTAYIDATIEAINALATRSNPRRFVITMTDGYNNSGTRDVEAAVSAANAHGIPVYTIGFEGGDEQELQYLATSTGATFISAESLDITQAYESIQSNIRFQYIADLNSTLVAPYNLTVSIDLDGDGVDEASRTLIAD